jgi:hypothetical protein
MSDGPRVVPGGSGVGWSQGRPGTAHALYNEPGYHRAPTSLTAALRRFWRRLTGDCGCTDK